MGTHAKLSPSSAYRWLACPGSVREEAKYPDPPSGPGAIDGTHSHTLLEHCLKNSGDPLKMVGVRMKDHEGEFVIDKDRAQRVRVALDYVRERAGFLGVVLPEQKVQPAHYLGRDDMSGTADVQITTPEVFEVVDYKDGMNEVKAEDNPQLELYALGALARSKLPVNGEYGFKTIRLTIVQPKLSLKGANPVVTHELTVPELMGKIGKFVTGAAATDDPNAPLVSGSHCKYCKHKSCSVRAGDVMKEMGLMFPNTAPATPVALNPVTEISQQAADMNPASMSSEQIAQIMLAAPLVRQMIEAVEGEALARLKSGQKIPGLKVVNGRGSRSWALPEDEMADKLIRMGIPKSAVYKTTLISPAQAEKLTWEKTKAGAKVVAQLSDRQRKTLDNEYVAKVAGKLTVVPESDPRNAVVLDASPLFAAVESEVPAWLK